MVATACLVAEEHRPTYGVDGSSSLTGKDTETAMNYQHHTHKLDPDRPDGRRARSRWWAVGLAAMTGLALTTVGVGVATATPAADAAEHPPNATDDRPSADDHRGKRDGGTHDNRGRGKDDV
ncbi:right-handed parallel beta-helix repeat-containing protein, partial [Salinispora arenicola]|nr:right-handed parallel beta-helix repeat-containing protein [Salinispora arenicola]